MSEFVLEGAITRWRDSMLRAGVGAAAMCELEDHLRQGVELAVEAGQAPEEAFAAVRRRLGEPKVIAGELRKESGMHPISKLVGFAVALFAIVFVMDLEGGHPTLLLQWPSLVLVLGVSFGGLVASFGPKLVWRVLTVGVGRARAEPEEVCALQAACRRGRRLAYFAGVLQALLAALHILMILDQPILIAPGIACAMIGLVHATLVAELGFGTMERWMGRDTEPITPSS